MGHHPVRLNHDPAERHFGAGLRSLRYLALFSEALSFGLPTGGLLSFRGAQLPTNLPLVQTSIPNSAVANSAARASASWSVGQVINRTPASRLLRSKEKTR